MILGVDISHYQDNNSTPQRVDFARMKAAGARFVYIKASQVYADEDFMYNWQAAKAAGLPRGAYHFLDIRRTAREQVDLFWSLLKDDPGELPPVVDFEGFGDNQPGNSMLYEFVTRLEALCGRTPMIYTGIPYWLLKGSKDPMWARYPLWLAYYSSRMPNPPAPWNKITIWQWGTPAVGIEFGAESKEIDSNYFTGSEDDFQIFMGGKQMGIWSTRARALYTQESMGTITTDMLKGYDAVIAKADGPQFHKTVDTAYRAGIPCLMFWQNAPTWYSGADFQRPDRWSMGLDDGQIRQMYDYVYAGTAKRAIHGLVVDFSDCKETEKTRFNGQWMALIARHVLDQANRTLKLPVYLYMNNDPFSGAEGNDLVALQNLLTAYGVCGVTLSQTGSDGYPVDGTRYNPPYEGKGVEWYFWLYSVIGGWKMLYNGDKATLYKELNYTGAVTPEPEPEPDPEPDDPVIPQPGGDFSALLAEAKLTNVWLAKLAAHLGVK